MGLNLSLSAYRGKAIPKARLLRFARNDTSNPSVERGFVIARPSGHSPTCHCEEQSDVAISDLVRPCMKVEIASLRSQ